MANIGYITYATPMLIDTSVLIKQKCRCIGVHESDTSMLEEMQQKLISIAEDFDKWLEEMAKKYNMPKDEIQALIKQFLIGL